MNNTIIKKENDFEVIQFEKCIVCKVETNIPLTKDVSERYGYIEGAGQLCKNCYNSID
jgi:hypothetical protein